MRYHLRFPLDVTLVVAAVLLTPGLAEAHGRHVTHGTLHPHHHHHHAHRRGGQAAVLLGAAMCLPGRAACRREAGAGGVTPDGRTRPSFGTSAELGYRFNPFVSAGAHYSLGFLDPEYEVTGASAYDRIFVHGVHGFVRPTLPFHRVDFGLAIGAGFSRQVLTRSGTDRDHADGFSALISPGIDVFLTDRLYLGGAAHFVFNAPSRTCRRVGGTTTCSKTSSMDAIPVHTVVFGLRLGGTFL